MNWHTLSIELIRKEKGGMYMTVERLLEKYRKASNPEEKERLKKEILNHPDYYDFIEKKICLATKDERERAALRAIFWQESRWNIFAVGDNGNSFGMGQIYKPVHENWVDFKRLTLPDVGYQVQVTLQLIRDLYKQLSQKIHDPYEVWFWVFYRYNGSGQHALWYARRILGIMIEKPWGRYLKKKEGDK